MKRWMLLVVVVVLVSGSSYAEFPETITIGDRTIECRTVEEVRKLGFECEDIPWKNNAARVLIDAMDLYKAPSRDLEGVLYNAARTFDFGKHAEEARKFLEDNRQVLDLLKQADGMAKYQFPMHRAERLVETQIFGLHDFQQFGRLLDYKVAYDFCTGKPREAVDDSFLAFRLGRRVASGHFLITWLVGTVVGSMGLQSLDRMTASGRLDEPMLQDIAKRLNKSGGPGDLSRPFRLERIWTFKFLEDMEKLPPEQRAAVFQKLNMPEVNAAEIQWDVVRKNLTELFDFYDTIAGKPVLESLRGRNSIEAFIRKREKDWDLMSRSFRPDLHRVFLAFGKSQVTFDAPRLRIALERFKLAKGAYPKSLAEVVPEYLDKLPLDPFSGKPYGYRLEEDGGFTLWSVGNDLKDDGGKSIPGNPWTGPDYVFSSQRDEPGKQEE